MAKKLYHGSTKIIEGKLVPKKAEDLEKHPENMIKAVYATDKKEIAIAMAIIGCKGVLGASLINYKKGKPAGKIYIGWPKQKYIYIYTLDKKYFKKSRGVKNQFISTKSVKPLKREKLIVRSYLHLIKRASKKEIESWSKKYKNW